MTTRGKLLSPPSSAAPMQFPSDLGGSLSSHYVLFSIYANTGGSGLQIQFNEGSGGPDASNVSIKRPVSESATQTIALYMPAQVANNQSAKYSEVSVGNAIAAYQAYDGSGDASAMDFMKNYIKTQAGNISAEAEAIASMREIAEGEVKNNRMEMLFESIDRRTFQFDFKMMPKSSDEAKQIQEIVQTFRLNMAPSIESGSSLRMRVPSLFSVQFRPNKTNALPKIGKSICTACNVTYGGARAQFFNDGQPVETSLSLTFQEIDLPTRERVEAGF